MSAAVAVAPEAATHPPVPTPTRPAWWRRPAVMCVALGLVYGALALAKDPRASLVADSGGKLATIRVMAERGDLDPDIGYWAAEADPDGLAHPIALTRRVGDKWVQVTTLPMIYAAVPLYELGGFRAVLLLPMLAGVLTALGARALARRRGDDGFAAFWLIGLATPVAVYALDFWEHAPGLAAMVWGVVLLLDVAEGRRGWAVALAGGALFGAAASMRTEAFVYAFVTFAVVGVAAWTRRRRFPFVPAGAALAGLGAVVAANQVLERWAVGTGVRAGRTTDAASRIGAELGTRVQDAFITSVGVNRIATPGDWLLGAVIVVGVAGATAVALRGRPESRRLTFWLLGVAFWGYFVVILPGVGFIPGALTASPLAAAGLAVLRARPDLRVLGWVAVGALPLVWLSQYTEGVTPIWSGRYLLLSSTLLAVLGVIGLRALPRPVAVALVLMAVLVTGSGLVWTSIRTRSVAAGWAALDRVDAPLVMAGQVQVMREGGAFYDPGDRWLAAADEPALRAAIDAVAASESDRLTVVSLEPTWNRRTLGPFQRVSRDPIEIVPGVRLSVVRYRR